MAVFRSGKVTRLSSGSDEMIRATVTIGDRVIDAVGFPRMLGPVSEGDRVVVNVTGIELDLGTGGDGFILWNLDGSGEVEAGEGHIVKLRYTPWQTEVMAAEAPESPFHDLLESRDRIDGVPVVACGLHSQVGAVAAGIKASSPSARVGYLMTDGAALPLAWSRNVSALQEAGLIDVTCTSGHAFGGDLESVNVFSGLIAVVHAGRADAVVVAMGPGVVGTSTALGFTAMEQGQTLDAVTALGGKAIAALRISFADMRQRHAGVSHHSLTALSIAARERSLVVLPSLPEEQARRVAEQLAEAGIRSQHTVVEADGGPGLRLLAARKIRPSSMGRDLEETPELFASASAAGAYAGGQLEDTLPR